jgi:hypothetical protein
MSAAPGRATGPDARCSTYRPFRPILRRIYDDHPIKILGGRFRGGSAPAKPRRMETDLGSDGVVRDDVFYDFEKCRFPSYEALGMSVFHRDSKQPGLPYLFVLRALSTCGTAPIYPRPRAQWPDEANLPFTMSWQAPRPLRGLKC